MKILLFCLFIGLTQCELGRPNEKCWRECDWKGYVALVTCKGAEDVCTCQKADGESCDAVIGTDDPDTVVDPLLKGKQTWEECHTLAMNNKDGPLQNEWFRWEDKFDNTTDDVIEESYCYFLPDCATETPSGCAPFAGAPCVAGPSTEECEEPVLQTCEPAKWDEDGLHWTCLSASGYETVSAYTDGTTKLPKGTTCQTGNGKDDECSTWLWSDGKDDHTEPKIAKVTCGDTAWESTNPDLLLKTDDTEPVDILPDGNDGVCSCIPLKISDESLNDPGLSLICDQAIDTSVGITNGNGCVLLCDGHFVMYIECYKGKWKDTSSYPFETVTEADVKC